MSKRPTRYPPDTAQKQVLTYLVMEDWQEDGATPLCAHDTEAEALTCMNGRTPSRTATLEIVEVLRGPHA